MRRTRAGPAGRPTLSPPPTNGPAEPRQASPAREPEEPFSEIISDNLPGDCEEIWNKQKGCRCVSAGRSRAVHLQIGLGIPFLHTSLRFFAFSSELAVTSY